MSNFTSKWGHTLEPYKNKNINYLEIGLYKGKSLPLWKQYFGATSKIYGIEIDLSKFNEDCKEYEIYEMDALDREKAFSTFKDVKFDVIIDDSCPHRHAGIFSIYSNFLKKDGIYLIETFKSKFQYFSDLSYLKKNYLNFNFERTYLTTSLEPAIKAKYL